MSKSGIMLFHRDLRTYDNTSLIKAVRDGYKIIPIFILTPTQIDPQKNKYFSHNAVQFMCQSLVDLDNQIRKAGGDGLFIVHDDNIKALEHLFKAVKGIEALYTNRDYTQYAQKRDSEIQKLCEKHSILFKSEEDYNLVGIHEGLVENERPYTVLAQFYKHFQKHLTVRKPEAFHGNFVKILNISIPNKVSIKDLGKFYTENPNIAIHGGRENGLERMNMIKNLSDYKIKRDYPALPKTSQMSAFLKFGNISIREFYWKIRYLFGKEHALIRELVFRDFYSKNYALYPELQHGKAFHDKLDKAIPWSYDKKQFKAWCEGLTGFPIVDAGMRQLNTIGWQHNRVRMITSNILTKYLLVDWRLGERYFAQKLVDYDPASNNMGWGFSSSVGLDPQPFFRYPFNAFIQSKKFDPDCEYIKRWVPELKDVDPKDIHKWGEEKIRAKYPNIHYPAPIVDQKVASQRAVRIYKEAYEKSKRV